MLFYVSTCKNTNKLRISHTFSQEKTKTERIEIDFQQKERLKRQKIAKWSFYFEFQVVVAVVGFSWH